MVLTCTRVKQRGFGPPQSSNIIERKSVKILAGLGFSETRKGEGVIISNMGVGGIELAISGEKSSKHLKPPPQPKPKLLGGVG